MREEALELVREVHQVVADNYLDARSGTFDLKAWDALRDRILRDPPQDTAAAHRCPPPLQCAGLG